MRFAGLSMVIATMVTGCDKILHALFACVKRTFENAFRKFPPIVWAFACLQFFRQRFFRSGSADCGHRFDLKLIGNLKFFTRSHVIESFHSMYHQTLVKALQGEILPRCAGIVRMRDRRLVVMIEKLPRNEYDENGSVLRPSFVRIDKQIEERLPMLRPATSVKRAPLLCVE